MCCEPEGRKRQHDNGLVIKWMDELDARVDSDVDDVVVGSGSGALTGVFVEKV